MSSSTYLVLVNKLLNRFNEVNLTSTTFGNARGVHALAKDAIIYSLNQVNQVNWKWPFNYVEGTAANNVLLVIGTNEYAYPTGAEDIDFDNIYLAKNTTLSVSAVRLARIGHDQYKRNLKDRDLNAVAVADYGQPSYVYRTPGLMIGISPKPKYAYTITAPYWAQPTQLLVFGDTSTVPDRFDDAIIDGGEVYMQAQRKNELARKSAEDSFNAQIKRMRKILINESADMESTQIQKPAGRSLLYLNSL